MGELPKEEMEKVNARIKVLMERLVSLVKLDADGIKSVSDFGADMFMLGREIGAGECIRYVKEARNDQQE